MLSCTSNLPAYIITIQTPFKVTSIHFYTYIKEKKINVYRYGGVVLLTGGGAHLSLVEEDAKHDPLNGGIQVCVLENEHCAFASQLQGHLHSEVVSADDDDVSVEFHRERKGREGGPSPLLPF
jgi:hypothetical protein